MKPTVVITHPAPAEVVRLLERSCLVLMNQGPEDWSRRALISHCLCADALMTRDAREVTRDVLLACRRLRVVAANSVIGLTAPDVDLFTFRGVWLAAADLCERGAPFCSGGADMALACNILQALSGDIPEEAVNQRSMIEMMASLGAASRAANHHR